MAQQNNMTSRESYNDEAFMNLEGKKHNSRNTNNSLDIYNLRTNSRD